jgi:hypothetical protein
VLFHRGGRLSFAILALFQQQAPSQGEKSVKVPIFNDLPAFFGFDPAQLRFYAVIIAG